LIFLLVDFPVDYFKYLPYFSFTIHSINITNPILPTYSEKWKYIYISEHLQ
jgi:hypothetical protein